MLTIASLALPAAASFRDAQQSWLDSWKVERKKSPKRYGEFSASVTSLPNYLRGFVELKMDLIQF